MDGENTVRKFIEYSTNRLVEGYNTYFATVSRDKTLFNLCRTYPQHLIKLNGQIYSTITVTWVPIQEHALLEE